MKKLRIMTIVMMALMLTPFMGQSQKKGEKKVAIATFIMNKKVQPGDLGLGGEALKQAADLAKNPAFSLEPMLQRLHDEFFGDLGDDMPFKILPESEVINHPEYKAYELNFDEDKGLNDELLSFYKIYDGYKYLREGGALDAKEKRDQNRLMEIFGDQADGVMFVQMWFEFKQKLAVGGTGTAGIKAMIWIQLFDKEGKKVFRYREGATSKKSVGIAAGVPVMKIEKILPMCENAFERMLEDMEKDMPKLAKKVAKKL